MVLVVGSSMSQAKVPRLAQPGALIRKPAVAIDFDGNQNMSNSSK
jgi:hypothetical protein